jgi:hypothetical protein
MDAMSFNGQSFAWFDLQKPIERHLSLTMKFKTRYGAGNLMYVAGRLDYSILEVKTHLSFMFLYQRSLSKTIRKLFFCCNCRSNMELSSIALIAEVEKARLDWKDSLSAIINGMNCPSNDMVDM